MEGKWDLRWRPMRLSDEPHGTLLGKTHAGSGVTSEHMFGRITCENEFLQHAFVRGVQ